MSCKKVSSVSKVVLVLAVAFMMLAQNGMVTAEAGTVDLSRILIVIDPGHTAGANAAAAVSGFSEGTWAYNYSLVEKRILEERGFTVIITRGLNDNPGLYIRGQMAVAYGGKYDAIVFMSNHSDAYGENHNTNASGVSAITSAFLSDKNTQLIGMLLDAVATEMRKETGNTYPRGIQTVLNDEGTDYYGVLRGSVSSAASAQQAAGGPVQYSFILEHGFHTNLKECSYLSNAANWPALASAKADAFVAFFTKNYPNPQPPTAPDPVTVQPDRASWCGTVSIIGDTLNLRTAPSSDNSSVIMELVNGTRVTVIGEAANQRYGDLWYQVDVNGTVGFVHSTWISPDSMIGVASAACFTKVYADKGATSLQLWPMLGPGNMVDVFAAESGWYRIRVGRDYVGYVRAADLILR